MTTAPSNDFYEILGVERSASQKEITSAYRKLAKEHHPDLNPDPEAAATFIRIRDAYEKLSDPKKRAEHDREWKQQEAQKRSRRAAGTRQQQRRRSRAEQATQEQRRQRRQAEQAAQEQRRQREAQAALNRQRDQARVLLAQAMRELSADDSDLDFDLKQELQLKIDMLSSWLNRSESSAAQIANARITLENTLERVRAEARKRRRRRQSDPKIAAVWRTLLGRHETGESFDVRVTGSNSGGLIADLGGIEAFIPISQIAAAVDRKIDAGRLAEYIGRTLRVKAIEVDRARNRAILSERGAVAGQRTEQKRRILDKLRVGDALEGRVTRIEDYGIFVDIGGIVGVAHISKLSWDVVKRDFVKRPADDLFSIGQTIQVYVAEIDRESERIKLSLLLAATGSWDQVAARFEIGQVVPAPVIRLTKAHAFVRLDGDVEAGIHVRDLTGQYVSQVSDIVAVGDVVPVKIISIDTAARRVYASLKQARAEAERAGWIFRTDGGIARPPDDIAARFGVAQPSSFDEPPDATNMSEALKRAQAERERKRVEQEQAAAEARRAQAERERKRAEREQAAAEARRAQAEREQEEAEREREEAERAQAARKRREQAKQPETAESRQRKPDDTRTTDDNSLEQYRARFYPARSRNGQIYATEVDGWSVRCWVGERQGEISACVFAPSRWSGSVWEETSESNLIDETCGDLDEAFEVLWKAEQSGEIVRRARGAIGAHNATL